MKESKRMLSDVEIKAMGITICEDGSHLKSYRSYKYKNIPLNLFHRHMTVGNKKIIEAIFIAGQRKKVSDINGAMRVEELW